ncbi:MAG: zinc ribbon domain-containing protein [Candidatus Lokiarchaeota archaeon]
MRELSSVYIHSLSGDTKDKSIKEVKEMLKQTINNVIDTLSSAVEFKIICKQCGQELKREGAKFCENCGEPLYSSSSAE